MKKNNFIIGTIFCIGLMTAGCDSSSEWENKSITSSTDYESTATLYISQDKSIMFGIQSPSDDCERWEDDSYSAGSLKFNGKMVKMTTQCVESGLRLDYPTTDLGIKYIINEFLTKAIVIVSYDEGEDEFSSNNFQENYNAIKLEALEEKKAI